MLRLAVPEDLCSPPELPFDLILLGMGQRGHLTCPSDQMNLWVGDHQRRSRCLYVGPALLVLAEIERSRADHVR